MTAADLNADAIGRKLLAEFRDMPEWKLIMAREHVDEMRIAMYRRYWRAAEIIADCRRALEALRDTEDRMVEA